MTDKAGLVADALEQLRGLLEELTRAANTTREGAVHEEAKPENDKDTRAVEQSYLARGQAQRVEDMAESITRLRFMELPSFGPDDPIAAGALVEVELDDESTQRWFVVPVGGGMTVEQAGETIRLITPASPVGQALVGKFEGDDFEVRVQRKVRHYAVLSVG